MSVVPDGTELGAVHLTVRDVERSVAYYRDAIGLELLGRENGRASLGAGGNELVTLFEAPGAQPVRGTTGLYHLALLLPTRADLARWLAHASRDGVAVGGASDHFVSEALYLRDPDRHGIEIYADRPREIWDGLVASRMTSLPLDLDDLLREVGDGAAKTYEGMPDGAKMGHIHLAVSDVGRTVAFYRDVLGFDLTAAIPGQAAFFAAGGYHHHVAGNTWESAGGSPPPPGAAALRHATVVLPTREDRDALLAQLDDAGHGFEDSPHGPLVRDPSGIPLVLAV